MTAIDDLIAGLQAAIDALQTSIRAASGCWETPLLEPEGPPPSGRESSSQDAWTPRDAAEHAIRGLALNVAFATQPAESRVTSLGDFLAAWRRRLEAGEVRISSAETSALAVTALAEVGTQSLASLRALPLDRLTQPVAFMPGQDAYMAQQSVRDEGDVATALRLSVAHLLDHAQQIQRAVDKL